MVPLGFGIAGLNRDRDRAFKLTSGLDHRPCPKARLASHWNFMKRHLFGAIALTMAAAPLAATAVPQRSDHGQSQNDHQDRGQHKGWGKDYGTSHRWRKGERMGYENWRSAHPIDYRQHHLRAPPRGYEWRRSKNGQYVLAAIASGLILSIINGSR